MQLTPSDINSLKSLSGFTSTTSELHKVRTDSAPLDKTYFQILLIEINNDSNDSHDSDLRNLLEMEQSGDITTKLVYGKRKDLIRHYPGVNALPSPGVEVDPKFASLSINERDRAIFATVRFLLQSRKLSQMMAFTWINEEHIPENKSIQISLVRDILKSYNLIPDTHWLNDDELSSRRTNKDLAKNLLNVEERYLNYLIKPEYISYSSIRLSLLLSGQAYYKYKDNPEWNKIWEPIFSTYEMIWEYALDVS